MANKRAKSANSRALPVFRSVPIAGLHEDDRNARRHPDRNAEVVRASLTEFGQVEALVVEAGTGRVLGGNLRLRELRNAGVEVAEVAEVDVHGQEADRLALALNRSAELAEWDQDALGTILRELAQESDLEGLGWTEEEAEPLLSEEPLKPWGWGSLDGRKAGGNTSRTVSVLLHLPMLDDLEESLTGLGREGLTRGEALTRIVLEWRDTRP